MIDPGIERNHKVFQEICLKYGCHASIESNDYRNEFRYVTIRTFTSIKTTISTLGYPISLGKSSPPFCMRLKSLKDPNWEKLEELVVNYAVLNSFTQ